MAKAGAPKKAKPKPKANLTDKEQSERFKQTARELGIGDGERFERVFASIARHKPKPKGG